MTKKELGKIRSVKFGSGGYQNAMIGFSFDLGGNNWGVSDFWGTWETKEVSATGNMAQEKLNDQRIRFLGESCMRISALLGFAKVDSLDRLKGIAIEVTFEDGRLESWRILKEVL